MTSRLMQTMALSQWSSYVSHFSSWLLLSTPSDSIYIQVTTALMHSRTYCPTRASHSSNFLKLFILITAFLHFHFIMPFLTLYFTFNINPLLLVSSLLSHYFVFKPQVKLIRLKFPISSPTYWLLGMCICIWLLYNKLSQIQC